MSQWAWWGCEHDEVAFAWYLNVIQSESLREKAIGAKTHRFQNFELSSSSCPQVTWLEYDCLNSSVNVSYCLMPQDTTRSFMEGGTGKRDRQKYDIYMEATALARIEDANGKSSVELASMHAEVGSEKDKHDLLMKDQKVLRSSGPSRSCQASFKSNPQAGCPKLDSFSISTIQFIQPTANTWHSCVQTKQYTVALSQKWPLPSFVTKRRKALVSTALFKV